VWGRNFSLLTAVVEPLQRAVASSLQNGNVHKVCLVAHSQGAIIAFDAISRLLHVPENERGDLSKLEVFSFGAAAKYTPVGGREANIFFEHHLNIFDPVACLGALWLPFGWTGTRYRYWRAGHLMNGCHLSHGVHPDSRFYAKCDAGLHGKPPPKSNPIEWQRLLALALVATVTTIAVLFISFLLAWAYLPAAIIVGVLVATDFQSSWIPHIEA
jgi:hypothetical protein